MALQWAHRIAIQATSRNRGRYGKGNRNGRHGHNENSPFEWLLIAIVPVVDAKCKGLSVNELFLDGARIPHNVPRSVLVRIQTSPIAPSIYRRLRHEHRRARDDQNAVDYQCAGSTHRGDEHAHLEMAKGR